MQSLVSLIAWQLALAAPAAEAQSAPAAQPYQSTALGYERLPPAERLRYAEQLVRDRLEPAARWALADDALQRQQQIDREILARLAAGQTISPRGLVKLLRKLDSLEAAAIDALSRSYRIEVYSLFHSQRLEYEARIAAWRRVQTAWEAAGRQAADQRLLIDWLRAATDRLRQDRLAQLPAEPKFARHVAAQPAPRAQPASPVRPAPAARPRPPEVVPPPARVARRPVERANNPPGEPAPLAPALQAGRVRSASQLPDLNRAPPRAGVEPVSRVASADTRARVAPPADPLPQGTLAARPLARRSAELRLALRPVDPPRESPAIATDDGPAPTASQPGRIDLDELSVRIAGHNLALARLAGRLQGKEAWSAAQLAAAFSELEDLTARRGDLLLYVDLIEPHDHSTVGKLQAASPTLTLLGAKIAAAREALLSGRNGIDPVHDEGLQALDQLSRRLAQLAPQAPADR